MGVVGGWVYVCVRCVCVCVSVWCVCICVCVPFMKPVRSCHSCQTSRIPACFECLLYVVVVVVCVCGGAKLCEVCTVHVSCHCVCT